MKKMGLISIFSCILSLPTYANMEQAIIAFDNGDLIQANQLITKVNDNDFNKHFYLSKIALKSGKVDQAESHINEALELKPNNGDLHFFYGAVMAAQAERANVFSKISYVKKVLKGFTSAVKFSPDNIKYRQSLMTFHLSAPGIIGGDSNEAIQQAYAIQALDKLSGVTAFMQVYAQLEDQEKLNNIYNKALSEFPNEPEIYYQKGMNFLQSKNYDSARIELNKAVKLPDLSDRQHEFKYMAMYQLGRASVLSKSHFDEGEKALNQYISGATITTSMPEKSWAKYRIANIAEFRGDKIKAKDLYNNVLQEAEDSELKNKAKDKVNKLR